MLHTSMWGVIRATPLCLSGLKCSSEVACPGSTNSLGLNRQLHVLQQMPFEVASFLSLSTKSLK